MAMAMANVKHEKNSNEVKVDQSTEELDSLDLLKWRAEQIIVLRELYRADVTILPDKGGRKVPTRRDSDGNFV